MNPLRLAHRALAIPAIYRGWSSFIRGNDPSSFARDHVRAEPGQRVLDIGCGPADILEYLPDVAYTGFDANAEYIATATKHHGDRGRFLCQRVDEAALASEPGFDVVLAVGVVHHLDDADAERLFRLASAALVPGGRLVTLDAVYIEGQNRIARLLISRDRGQYVRTERGYLDIAGRVFERTRPVIRTDMLRIPYTHLILECEKT